MDKEHPFEAILSFFPQLLRSEGLHRDKDFKYFQNKLSGISGFKEYRRKWLRERQRLLLKARSQFLKLERIIAGRKESGLWFVAKYSNGPYTERVWVVMSQSSPDVLVGKIAWSANNVAPEGYFTRKGYWLTDHSNTALREFIARSDRFIRKHR